jgi:hypothetical protein
MDQNLETMAKIAELGIWAIAIVIPAYTIFNWKKLTKDAMKSLADQGLRLLYQVGPENLSDEQFDKLEKFYKSTEINYEQRK